MIGSRAQVFHGTADQTAGGLKKKDLILDNGEIKSKAAQQAALARMKKEGKKHLVNVFKPTKKDVSSFNPRRVPRRTRRRCEMA